MSRAIPLLGAHEHTGWCMEIDCQADAPIPTRKQRRWVRRRAAKEAKRERRRADRGRR